MEVPDLGGIDAVPVRSLPRLEQEVDRRSRAARAFVGHVTPRFSEMTALRMGLQVEVFDDRRCVHGRILRPTTLIPLSAAVAE